jgi:hypothetical protein
MAAEAAEAASPRKAVRRKPRVRMAAGANGGADSLQPGLSPLQSLEEQPVRLEPVGCNRTPRAAYPRRVAWRRRLLETNPCRLACDFGGQAANNKACLRRFHLNSPLPAADPVPGPGRAQAG